MYVLGVDLCPRVPLQILTYSFDDLLEFVQLSDSTLELMSGEKSIVGGAIYGYLAVPQVNNWIFREPEYPIGRPNGGGDGKVFATDDPDDIIYPAAGGERIIDCDEYNPQTTAWGNSYLGVSQGTNTWTYTMGPGSYSQSFPLNLDSDKLKSNIITNVTEYKNAIKYLNVRWYANSYFNKS